MANTNIKKLYFNKVCLEDIEWGDESEIVNQTRNSQVVQLHKINPDKTTDITKTSITYGITPPPNNINPVNGINALYIDTHLNDLYYCEDATTDANVWIKNSSGQFVDHGTPTGSGVQYMAQVSGVEDIVIKTGTNAFSVDSFTLADGATLTIEDGAVYKVL